MKLSITVSAISGVTALQKNSPLASVQLGVATPLRVGCSNPFLIFSQHNFRRGFNKTNKLMIILYCFQVRSTPRSRIKVTTLRPLLARNWTSLENSSLKLSPLSASLCGLSTSATSPILSTAALGSEYVKFRFTLMIE